MAIALDSTAHPTNAANLFATQNGTFTTISNATPFSTGAGPLLLVAVVVGEFGSAPTSLSVDNTSHLDWELDVDKTSPTQELGATDFFGCQIWTAFSSGGSLSSQTVTATLNATATGRKAALWVLVLNGVASTHAGCIGSSAGFVDGSSAGVNQQVSASLTPAATGSWIVLGLGQTNDSAVLTANSNTSAYDNTFQPGGAGDYFAFGRLKSSGAVATTTASSAVTVGSSVSDLWGFIAALEIKAPSSGAALTGSSAGTATSTGSLSLKEALSGTSAGTSTATGTLGNSARLTGTSAGTSTATGTLSEKVALSGTSAGQSSASGVSVGPAVFPLSLVLPVSTTRLFVASPVPTWAVVEGSPGGTISAGTGGNATYTAPATPGTYHVTATVGAAVVTVPVTVITAPTNPTVRLDSPLQVMDGFGCASGDSEPALITDALADLLYDPTAGVGFSIHRMGINPDISGPRHDPGDYATFAWDLWGHVKKAVARGARVICGPWTPPAAIKDNAALIGGHLNSGSYATWANSLASFVTLAAAQTPPIPIYAISPQNEPDFGTGHDSCIYSAAQMRDFIKALGPALAALPSAQRPLLFAPESSDPTLLEGYLSTLEADSTALGYTGIYATHQYGNATMPAATRAARLVWQTEMSGLAGGPEATFDATITDGIAIAKWVHSAIANGNVTAWIWWWGIKEYNTGSLPYTGSDNEALILTDGDLTPSPITQFSLTKRLFTIGQFSKFVRPGYQRVNLIGTLPTNVSATAYQDPVTGKLVVVCINEGGTSASLTLAVAGGTAPAALTPYVTSGTALGSIGSSGNLEQQTAISLSGGTLTATLAASSVTTFVSGAAPLSGTSAGAATSTGSLREAVALSGSSAGAATSTGTLAEAVALTGSSAGTSTATGSLSGSGALSGSSAGSSTATGTLREAVALQGSSAGVSTATGNLTTGGVGALQGSSAGTSTATGTLSESVALQGSSAGQAGSAAALSLAVQLQSSSAGQSTSSGTLRIGAGLQAASAGASGATGALALAVALSGVSRGLSTATGTLGHPVTLARGVSLRGQPSLFATFKGQAGFPVLWGQGDS